MTLPESALLLPAVPIGLWVIYSDMRYMKIRNVACLTLFIWFLILGPFIFDLNEYGIRIVQAVVVLILGFFVSTMGFVGGGDSKFAAAMAPFIALNQLLPFVFIVGIMAFLSLALHKTIGVTPGLKNVIKNWDSWNTTGMFPFGVTLAASLIAYLILNLLNS